MNLRDIATFLLYSNVSMGILIILMLILFFMWFKYMRASQRHRIAIESPYITKDDIDPEERLTLMQAEFRNLRSIVNIRVNRFYYALGAVMVYVVLLTASSHYLR